MRFLFKYLIFALILENVQNLITSLKVVRFTFFFFYMIPNNKNLSRTIKNNFGLTTWPLWYFAESCPISCSFSSLKNWPPTNVCITSTDRSIGFMNAWSLIQVIFSWHISCITKWNYMRSANLLHHQCIMTVIHAILIIIIMSLYFNPQWFTYYKSTNRKAHTNRRVTSTPFS